MKLYDEILEKSTDVDNIFLEGTTDKVIFTVPSFHPRADVKEYPLQVMDLEEVKTKATFIVDSYVVKIPFVKKYFESNNINPIVLDAIEDKVKTKEFMDQIQIQAKKIVVIGGGLIMNVGAYLAERAQADLILIPTTVLAMADSSGGKVRVNHKRDGRAYKHFYKSFYEPNAMYIDPRFLSVLPKKQIQIGLVEVIKHAIFQSPALYDYLFETGKELFEDKEKLLKAVMWSAYLKKICMLVDVEENENGSRRILRGGHDFSDRIEEDEMFLIPHGIAVAIGIIQQLEMEEDNILLNKATKLFDLLEIPYTLEKFKIW